MSDTIYEYTEIQEWERSEYEKQGFRQYGIHRDLRDDERTRLKMRREIKPGPRRGRS
jgi:hypothetical protein